MTQTEGISWTQHIGFSIIVFSILVAIFPIQLLLGADFYTPNPWGYTDQPWYNLDNTKNFSFLHGLGLISVTGWVLWSGWRKSLLNLFIGLVVSSCLTVIIFLVVQMDWLYNCMDFCGFGTAFFMPFVLLGVFCIALFFPSKSNQSVKL